MSADDYREVEVGCHDCDGQGCDRCGGTGKVIAYEVPEAWSEGQSRKASAPMPTDPLRAELLRLREIVDDEDVESIDRALAEADEACRAFDAAAGS